MPHTSRAWVMDVAAGWRVAAGTSQVVEYLLAPETIDVPRTPKHCAGLLIWRERMIPVIDFAPLQTEPTATTPWMEEADRVRNKQSTTAKTRRAVILAYQDAPAQPLRYGALLVTAAPTEFWVSDDMAGPLAEMPAAFTHIARACFVRQGQVIPILDAHQLFTRPLLRLPASASAAAPGATLNPPSMELDEVNERIVHLGESTFAGHLEPAAIEASPPVAPPEPVRYDLQAAGMAVDEAVAAAYCVVLPFPSSRPADTAPASAESVHLVEVGDLPEFVSTETGAPAETESFVVLDDDVMDSGENATSVGVAAATVQQERSNTLQSFQRLHAIEQAIEGRDLRPRQRSTASSRRGLPRSSMGARWQPLAAAVGLAILIGALFMFMDFSVRAPAPAQESVARDVAPGGINPASVPSTPAQPPK